MRILIIHQYFLEKKSGGGSRFNQFAQYWAARGHKVTVIAGTVDYATGKKNQEYKGKFISKKKYKKNITVLRCHVSESYNKNFLGRLWAYISFMFSSVWAGLVKTKKQDIIIASSPPLFVALPAYFLKKIKKIPLIFEVRDLWPKFAIDTGVITNKFLIKISYWLEKFIYKKSNLINVLTPAFKKNIASRNIIPEKKIVYIPNAADLNLMKPKTKHNYIRKKYNWKDKFIILYVGAHGVANDLWQILNVAKSLKNNKNIIFLLVGDGMQKKELIKKAKKHHLRNIRFLDTVPKDKIGDFINAADVCTATLQPVFTTTYPNKVFDYMACAKPIILPIDGVCRDLVVENAKAGIFVKPRDTKEFKNAIMKLYRNPQKCEKLGQNGYKFITKNFDRKKLSQKYLNTISKISKK